MLIQYLSLVIQLVIKLIVQDYEAKYSHAFKRETLFNWATLNLG